MEQLEGTFKDGEEIKKSLCESISGVNERETEEENFTNLAFENSQIGELLDDKKPIEQDAEIGVTQACKDLCEAKPKDIILLENNIQEAKKENCFIKTSIENRVDDEHLDGSPGKVSLEFSFSIACSDENMGFSKDSQTDMSSGNRDVNTTRFKQDIEELKTECEKNNKMKVGEVILMDDVRVDRRSPHIKDGSSTMNTCEGADNKAGRLKPRLQDECFEQGKNDLETGSELICQEITPETHTNEGHSVMKSEKPRNEENTNSDHAIISTADQTDSNLHNKFTDASNVNDNEHELREASSHASTNGDGSVDREPVDRKTQKAETDFIAENIVKEDQFVLCSEDKTETKEPSSVEICETHEPISDERKVIELEKRDPLLQKTKLARQPHIDHSLLSNKSDEYAPTPPGAESIANHTNTSSDNQVSSSTLSGFPREVNDNFENNTSTSSRIQTSQEMPSTNSLPSRDSVAEHSAVSVQSPDNNMCEPSNTEIPLASTRLLTRFPKKLVKTLSNPPGGIVERGAVIDTSSPCTSSGQEPTKYKTLKKRLLRKSKSEPGKEDPSELSEVRHKSFVDSLFKKFHKGVDHISTKVQGESTKRHTVFHNENIDEDHTNTSGEFYLPRTKTEVPRKCTENTGHDKLSKKGKFFGGTKRRSEKRAKKVMSVIEESSRIRNDDFEDFAHIQMYLAAKETLHK